MYSKTLISLTFACLSLFAMAAPVPVAEPAPVPEVDARICFNSPHILALFIVGHYTSRIIFPHRTPSAPVPQLVSEMILTYGHDTPSVHNCDASKHNIHSPGYGTVVMSFVKFGTMILQSRRYQVRPPSAKAIGSMDNAGVFCQAPSWR
ncbi:hypothetical protein FIBSPDRAFT_892559 [Athelia psychrophila]|uniref:Uncharacterized protein n=1 Tax=Athelia psychrophila TaxID=1759441 RepID=A0A166I9N5_9AGAM|nr:hypothetical protein FIBSPDRAFT_892559 [Fibularhizoctonia sp. CBS 109695]